MLTLAATTTPVGGASEVFLNYGAIGAMVIVLGMFAFVAWKRERDRSDRLEAQLQAANQQIIDRFVQVLTEVKQPLSEYNEYLRDLLAKKARS